MWEILLKKKNVKKLQHIFSPVVKHIHTPKNAKKKFKLDFYYLSSQRSMLCSLSSLKEQTPVGSSHHIVQSAHSLLATSPTMHLAHSPSQSIDRTCLQSPPPPPPPPSYHVPKTHLSHSPPVRNDTRFYYSSSHFPRVWIQVCSNLVHIYLCFHLPIFRSLVFHPGIQ